MSELYDDLKDVHKDAELAPKLPPLVASKVSSTAKPAPVVKTSAKPSTQPVKSSTPAPKPTKASTTAPAKTTTPTSKVVASSALSSSLSSLSASTQSSISSLPPAYTSTSITTVLPAPSSSTQSLSVNNVVSSTSTPTSSSSPTSSFIGPVVGSIAGVAFIGALAFFIVRRRRQLREQSYLDNFIEENDGSTMSPSSMTRAPNLNTDVWGMSPAAINDPSKRFSHQRFPPASPQIQYANAQYQNFAAPQVGLGQKNLPPLPPLALQQQAYGPAPSSPHLGAYKRPLSANMSYANAGQSLTTPFPAATYAAAGGTYTGATLAPGQRAGNDRPRLASFAFSDRPLFELADDGGSDFSAGSDQALQQAAAPVGLAPRGQPQQYQRSPQMRASQLFYGQPWQYQQQGYAQQQQNGYNPQPYYAPRPYQPAPYGATPAQQSMRFPSPVIQYDNEQGGEAMHFPVPPARVEGAISPTPAMNEAAKASVSDNVARNPLPPLRNDNITSVHSESIETLGAMTAAAAAALEMEPQNGNVEESRRVSQGSRSRPASRGINQEAGEQERRTSAEQLASEMISRSVGDLTAPQGEGRKEDGKDEKYEEEKDEKYEEEKDEKYEEEQGQQKGYYGERQEDYYYGEQGQQDEQEQQEGYYDEQRRQQEGYYDEQGRQQEGYYEQPQYENAYVDEEHNHARETLYGLGDTYYNSSVPSGYKSGIQGYESEVPPLPESGTSLEKDEHPHEEERQGRERYDSGVPSRHASGVTGYASGVTGYESESGITPYGGFREVDEEEVGMAH
ncbi:hypothetical protein BC937DRAFT_94807 [Endogone sp. FLAS-F59071]|nr:hypothetical protein BC937DRAFT_94807 [Endogone sp. FLAS-F59071]|eukprot:RUS13776.1 hypothetical protein BC937DRAFT_94807 [Endogone sp. FLAS-F59071]